MKRELLLGNEAVARAAYEAGVTVATAYPGTPSTEITENIVKYSDIYCEWAPNEKVALEVAIGASIAGARAICSMKHVGLNVAADPLFTVSYTGVNGGLVVMVADDPGMHSSQNEQDSRYYGLSAKIPVLEPSDSQECLEFVKKAFEISEEFDTPVIVRLTTRVAHSRSLVQTAEREKYEIKEYVKNPGKYVMMPAMARRRHMVVEDRMQRLKNYSETVSFNKVIETVHTASETENNSSPSCKRIGIITAGMSYQYTMEAGVGGIWKNPTGAECSCSILKLGFVYPMPEQLIKDFAATVDTVYVIEELSPFMEEYAKMIGLSVIGKEKLPAVGELDAKMIRDLLGLPVSSEFAAISPERTEITAEVLPARPPVLCPGCPHRGVFYILKKMKLNVSGDIGCYTLGALPPLEAIDTCVCMGASIGIAHGIDKARGRDFSKKTVAVIGDSTFLHSGVTGLMDVVYNKGTSTVLILDNSITGMTGHQQNPATGYTIRNEETYTTDIVKLCEAIGVPSVRTVDPFDVKELERVLKEEINSDKPSVIIAQRPCALLKSYRPEAEVRIDSEKCTKCKQCMGISCAAISDKNGVMQINDALCVRCGLCSRICKFGAIVKVQKEEKPNG